MGKPVPSRWNRCLGLLATGLGLTVLALVAPPNGNASVTDTSSGPWIVLESGRLGDQVWSIRAMHSGGGSSSGTHRSRRSCLSVGAIRQIGAYNFHRSSYRRCKEIPARSGATDPPLIASGIFKGDGTDSDLTAVGMMFPAGVSRAQITLSDGSSTLIRAHRLDSEEARRAGLGGYRYAAFSVRGPWCAVRMASQSRSGRTLWAGAIETAC